MSDLRMLWADECPSLADKIEDLAERSWPTFMTWGSEKQRSDWDALYEVFPQCQFGLMDGASNELVAAGNSIPLEWDQPVCNLPRHGWDWAVETGHLQRKEGVAPNCLCALSIHVAPEFRGRNVSRLALEAMRRTGQRQGFPLLIAPVRPIHKWKEPEADIEAWCRAVRPDGLPADPWIRVHVEEGGSVLHGCPESMSIRAPLPLWREWTQLPLDQDGPVVVEALLAPLQVDLKEGVGHYVEPNMWVRHDLALDPSAFPSPARCASPASEGLPGRSSRRRVGS